MMVGEVWPRDPRSLADYLRRDELQQAFNFRFLFSPWKASAFRSRIEEVEIDPRRRRRGRPTRFRITISRGTSRATAPTMPKLARGWRPCCCSRCAARRSSTMARKSACRRRDSRRSQARSGRPGRMSHADAVDVLAQRRLHDRIGGVAAASAIATPSMSRSSLAMHHRCCHFIGARFICERPTARLRKGLIAPRRTRPRIASSSIARPRMST